MRKKQNHFYVLRKHRKRVQISRRFSLAILLGDTFFTRRILLEKLQNRIWSAWSAWKAVQKDTDAEIRFVRRQLDGIGVSGRCADRCADGRQNIQEERNFAATKRKSRENNFGNLRIQFKSTIYEYNLKNIKIQGIQFENHRTI